MKPSERLLPLTLTSKTAIALSVALATYKVFSFGESARLFGVAPGGASAYRVAESVSIARPNLVSNTVTVLRFAFATYRTAPLRVSAISQGCSSDFQVA